MDTIIAVDVTPRWLYGHTQLDVDEKDEPFTCDMVLAIARIHQRLNVLMTEGSPGFSSLAGVRTVIAVELENLHRIRLSGLKGDRLLLCGVYGDECMFETARQLRRRGYEVALLEDVCLWSAPLSVLLDDEPTARELNQVPRLRAIDLWPNLANLAGDAIREMPDLWTGDPPSF